jgi:hypothetical protein
MSINADAYPLFEIRIATLSASLPATNAKRLRKGALAMTASAEARRAKEEAIHSHQAKKDWIASRSLPSGARSRDPVARNDVACEQHPTKRKRPWGAGVFGSQLGVVGVFYILTWRLWGAGKEPREFREIDLTNERIA